MVLRIIKNKKEILIMLKNITNNKCVYLSNEFARGFSLMSENGEKLTKRELSLIAVAMAMIDKNCINASPKIKFSLYDFSEFLGHKIKGGKCKSEWLNIIDNLKGRCLSIIRNNTHYKSIPIFDCIRIIDGHFVELKFSKAMSPYLLNQRKNMTVVPLHNLLSLNSIYSMRMYFFACSYRKIDCTQEYMYDTLKQICGVRANCNFGDKVLTPSIDDIRENTNLNLSIVKGRDDFYNYKLRFTIERKRKKHDTKILSCDIDYDDRSCSLSSLDCMTETKRTLAEKSICTEKEKLVDNTVDNHTAYNDVTKLNIDELVNISVKESLFDSWGKRCKLLGEKGANCLGKKVHYQNLPTTTQPFIHQGLCNSKHSL